MKYFAVHKRKTFTSYEQLDETGGLNSHEIRPED